MKHSIFSASGAERWSNCPGSLALSQGIHKSSSWAADEGTAGHHLGERCIADDSEPYDFIGEIIPVAGNGGDVITNEIEVTLDLAEAVSKYVEYVRGISGTRWLETRIYYATLLGVPEDEGFGTGDCCVLNGTILHVIDAKFGRGYVNPVKNKQMILYGAGVVDAMEAVGEEITEIHLHVMQPRVSDKPVPYVMTRADLQAEVDALRDRAQLAMEATISFTSLNDTAWVRKYLNPGEYQCQWCPAASFCPALKREVDQFTAASDEEFGIVSLLEQLPGEALGKYQTQVGLVEIWVKAVEHETVRRLTRGDKVPGYKLVKGREGNRKWADPVAAAEAFKDVEEIAFDPPTLKSPAQLEKALKKDAERKKLIEEYVVRNPARPTMTTEDDPRETWQEAAGADEFAVLSH